MDPLDPEHEFRPATKGGASKSQKQRETATPAAERASHGDLNQYDYSVQTPAPPPPPPPGPPPPQVVWTQHRDPSGRIYYHHAATKESRWDHPPDLQPPPPPPHPQANGQPNVIAKVESVNAEHVLAMKKIPTTSWAIVLTNQDKEFFYNLTTKESLWDMPDDLGDLIGELIAEAMGVDINEEFNDHPQSEAGSQVGDVEVEPHVDEQVGTKRKAPEDETADLSPKRRKSDVKEEEPPRDVIEKSAELTISAEDKTTEFMTLLREMDVSPYTTWEKELPKIIDDRRYGLLPTLRERKAVFDQYCVIRVAELREQKAKTATSPKDAYVQLLKENTTQRTRWEEFSRKHKRDKRFANLAPAKERETLFKAHMAELKGEKSRADPRKAKEDFLRLLEETKGLDSHSSWRRTQRDIERDPRYRAIRSSEEREDIFRAYIRKLEDGIDGEKAQREKEDRERERKAREEASLREREAQVRRDQSRLTREMTSQRQTLQTQDARTVFESMLIDIVRSADAEWADMRPYLERDPNWHRCQVLDEAMKMRVFSEHLAHLHEKRLAAFHASLQNTTDLTTSWTQVQGWILQDPRARKLARADDPARLEAVVKSEFESFQTARLGAARSALLELLAENNFVKFYVKNAVGECRAAALEEGKPEPKEGDEWGYINLMEIGKVLNEDKRYLQLEHFAGEREQKVKEHVRDLIRRYRAEKGGTVDRTLA
ncbi:hypothetical protein PhCBS80983_g03841 [Powellomyces hirtus]|uniref:WW domain-containing protein n=1 Tax=Powellomyces hirtus TaxID=109895 RepID=A0A507E263_9FUNG|nr:hypothetical protein PhCBS80983_g03841 [Powellomyces hirtus]